MYMKALSAPEGNRKDMKRPVPFLDIKVPVLLKLMCVFDVVSVKITAGFFFLLWVLLNKLILCSHEKISTNS